MRQTHSARNHYCGGTSRLEPDYFREHMRGGSSSFPGIGSTGPVADFAQGLFYCSGDIDNPELPKLKDFLSELDGKRGRWGTECSTSLSPKYFAEAIQQLGAAGMLTAQDSPGNENPLVET